jgi:ribosome-binding ATPase YchF (GTP1/OBG family)
MLILLNIDDDADESVAEAYQDVIQGKHVEVAALRGKLEEELAQMEEEEAAEFLAEFDIPEPRWSIYTIAYLSSSSFTPPILYSIPFPPGPP